MALIFGVTAGSVQVLAVTFMPPSLPADSKYKRTLHIGSRASVAAMPYRKQWQSLAQHVGGTGSISGEKTPFNFYVVQRENNV